MRTLLDARADINAVCDVETRRTALHIAAWCGAREAVAILLESGADTAAADAEGDTALDVARNEVTTDFAPPSGWRLLYIRACTPGRDCYVVSMGNLCVFVVVNAAYV